MMKENIWITYMPDFSSQCYPRCVALANPPWHWLYSYDICVCVSDIMENTLWKVVRYLYSNDYIMSIKYTMDSDCLPRQIGFPAAGSDRRRLARGWARLCAALEADAQQIFRLASRCDRQRIISCKGMSCYSLHRFTLHCGFTSL